MPDELGTFLRRRREALTPEVAGLTPSGRRRTPGLRRDEVAELASMSTVYYERIEQGRGPKPSPSVLAGLVQALQLTEDQREHLYRLAGHAAPTPPEPAGYVDPGLLSVLTAVAPTTPGFISDELGTVVAQNPLNIALFGQFTGRPGYEPNLIWRWFTSPPWRAHLEPETQHEQTGRAYVADLRTIVARRAHDPTATTLVADLRKASDEFAAMWEDHEVAALHCATKQVNDARVGRLDLDCVIMLSPHSRQRMLLLHPHPETETANRLAALNALLAAS